MFSQAWGLEIKGSRDLDYGAMQAARQLVDEADAGLDRPGHRDTREEAGRQLKNPPDHAANIPFGVEVFMTLKSGLRPASLCLPFDRFAGDVGQLLDFVEDQPEDPSSLLVDGHQ